MRAEKAAQLDGVVVLLEHHRFADVDQSIDGVRVPAGLECEPVIARPDRIDDVVVVQPDMDVIGFYGFFAGVCAWRRDG